MHLKWCIVITWYLATHLRDVTAFHAIHIPIVNSPFVQLIRSFNAAIQKQIHSTTFRTGNVQSLKEWMCLYTNILKYTTRIQTKFKKGTKNDLQAGPKRPSATWERNHFRNASCPYSQSCRIRVWRSNLRLWRSKFGPWRSNLREKVEPLTLKVKSLALNVKVWTLKVKTSNWRPNLQLWRSNLRIGVTRAPVFINIVDILLLSLLQFSQWAAFSSVYTSCQQNKLLMQIQQYDPKSFSNLHPQWTVPSENRNAHERTHTVCILLDKAEHTQFSFCSGFGGDWMDPFRVWFWWKATGVAQHSVAIFWVF